MKNIIMLGVFVCVFAIVLVGCSPDAVDRSQSPVIKEGENFSMPLSKKVNLDMIWVNPGTFTMGSPEDELGREDDETQHQVTISKGFWLGKYEITVAQYQAVIGKKWGATLPYSYKWIEDDYPAYRESWESATNFCAKLTKMERKAGRLPEGYEYTLPTEAQWEYACRAGTTTALNSGKDLSNKYECPNLFEVGWCDPENHSVGQKQPNAWGFYDMHGNVCEWCLDWYGDYPTNSVTDPISPAEGTYRILRGGNWDCYSRHCRSAYREYSYSDSVDGSFGIRVALSAVQK